MLKRAGSSSFSLRSGSASGGGRPPDEEEEEGRRRQREEDPGKGKKKKSSSLRGLLRQSSSSCSPPRHQPNKPSSFPGQAPSASSTTSSLSGSPSSSSCSPSSADSPASPFSHRISSWGVGSSTSSSARSLKSAAAAAEAAAPPSGASESAAAASAVAMVFVVVARECDTNVPVIGSIECIRSGGSGAPGDGGRAGWRDVSLLEKKPARASYRSLMGLSKALSYDDVNDEGSGHGANSWSRPRRLPAASSSVVRIVCFPPPPPEGEGGDGEGPAHSDDEDEASRNEDLVRFLVDSIGELVDREQDGHGGGEAARGDGAPAPSAVEGVLEALSFACANPCAAAAASSDCASPLQRNQQQHQQGHHGQVPYRRTKSILRTRGVGESAGRSPHEAGILSDRTVSFSRLEIREFGMTLGDHPSAVSGPPVALDYDDGFLLSTVGEEGDDEEEGDPKSGKRAAAAPRVISVEEYERARTPRRARRQLKLSYHDKCATLRDRGFSLQELHDAWAEAIKIRRQRQETLKQTYTGMVLDDAWESAGRKYRRVLESLALA